MSTTLASTALVSSAAIAPTASVNSSGNTSSADAPTDEETLGTSSQAIIACNSLSVAACVLVIVIYVLLYRKHTRLMQRTSLVLSVAMSVSDLLLHVSLFFIEIDENEVATRTALSGWRRPPRCLHATSQPSSDSLFPDIHPLSQRTNKIVPLQATNLVGYFNLPPGFACAFVGGWMFAFPTLLSVFYSCCIALNSQLYFVFRREPSDTGKGIGTMLKWYLFTPIVVSGIICKSCWD